VSYFGGGYHQANSRKNFCTTEFAISEELEGTKDGVRVIFVVPQTHCCFGRHNPPFKFVDEKGLKFIFVRKKNSPLISLGKSWLVHLFLGSLA